MFYPKFEARELTKDDADTVLKKLLIIFVENSLLKTTCLNRTKPKISPNQLIISTKTFKRVVGILSSVCVFFFFLRAILMSF